MVSGEPGQAALMRLTIEGLVYDAVDVPLFGAYDPSSGKDTLPTVAPSRFVVLIDPATGAFLHARTF